MTVPSRGNKMISFIDETLHVTLADGREMTGTFKAFDKHMNIVLTDALETRTHRKTQEKITRQLGLVLLRGEHVVGVRVEKKAAGVGADVAAGTGTAAPAPARPAAEAAPALPGKKK